VAQREIEIILMRQLASYLTVPIFVVDPAGTLLFYNEPAEGLLGRVFDEAGEMPMGEWSTIFRPTDDEGRALEPDALPLVVALKHRQPARRALWIVGLDGVPRKIDVVAFPLIGQGNRLLGAAAILWDVNGR
jgi:PAS domain-containing protein